MKKNVLYILFCFLFCNGYGQDTIENISIDSAQVIRKTFNKDHLQEYKAATDFDYSIVKEAPNFLDKTLNWLGRILKKNLGWFLDDIEPAVGLIKAILEVIPYLIMGLALYFMIRFFIRMKISSNAGDAQKIDTIYTSVEEELIKNENLEKRIQEAIEAQNYRLAIRYYYLSVLKKLTDKELVIWQPEKTNEEYVAEINQAHLQQDFMKATRLYDFVWYGNFDINEKEFKNAQALFITFTNKIVE